MCRWLACCGGFLLLPLPAPAGDAALPAGDAVSACIVYCVAPLAELSGDGSVTLGELHYAGRIDWRPPE